MVEPCDFGLGLCGDNRLGGRHGNKFVFPTEDEELRHVQISQHFVLIGPLDQSVQDGHHPVAVAHRDQFGQLLDHCTEPFAVFRCKSFRSKQLGDQLFLIRTHQFDLPAAVLPLLFGIGIRC